MSSWEQTGISRREMIQKTITGLSGLGLGISTLHCTSGSAGEQAAKAPNILLLVADDAGWRDVGYHGSEIKTPHLDSLMKEGVELNQFYVCPTCSPTRASLLTGRFASRYGILGPIAMKSEQTLPADTLTLPALLRQNGYSTAITGKWHLGLRPEHGPRQYGFDHTYGYLHGQIDQYSHIYKNGDRSWHRNDVFIEEEGHATDLIKNEAINFITSLRDKNKPFFLYVPFSVPHYPLQEENKWVETYSFIENESRRLYAASLSHLDNALGELVSTLDAEDLRENTLVIFISDNGGQEEWFPTFEYEGRHGPNDRLGDNRPLRDWKGSLYEGGIRVPAFLNWPSRLEPRRVEQVSNAIDLYPTIASLAGALIPECASIEGSNLWEAASADLPPVERTLYWRTSEQIAVRRGAWKLVSTSESPEKSSKELFNLAKDPNETQNLAEIHPEIVASLSGELLYQSQLDGY